MQVKAGIFCLSCYYNVSNKLGIIMRIHKTNVVKKFLPSSTTRDVESLMWRMNSQRKATGAFYGFSFLTKDKHPNELIFRNVSNRGITEAEIKLGDKITLTINPRKGEIFESKSKKPFWFCSWNRVAKKLEETVREIQANFDNPEVVEKKFIEYPKIMLNESDVLKLRAAQKEASKKPNALK